MDTPEGSGDATLSDSMFQAAAGEFRVVHEVEEVHEEDDDDKTKDDEPLREQDRFLPIANVARIMKKSIPKTGKIAKDAKECVQECVSEFISFITSEASERCAQEKRKTINGEDILFAMSTLGFDNYVEPLKGYLQKYRESTKGDKGSQSEELELSEDGQFSKLLVTHQPLTTALLTDQPGNIVYTGTAPGSIGNFSQIPQQFNLG